jgi:hypothetical protein
MKMVVLIKTTTVKPKIEISWKKLGSCDAIQGNYEAIKPRKLLSIANFATSILA